jgi:hypothetical protein
MFTLTFTVVAAGLVVDSSVRAEGRAGTAFGGQGSESGAFSANVDARASGPDASFRLELAPSALVAAGNQFFAAGTAEGGLRLDPGSSLRLRQRFGYGIMDFSALAASTSRTPLPDTTPVQPPPSSRFVSIQESFTSLELDLEVSRRLNLHGFAGWNVSGGADATSRAEIPLSRGPRLRTSAEWAATRLDSLRAELAATDYTYSNGRRASIATVTGGWERRLAPDAELMIVLGPGAGRAQSNGQRPAVVLYGVAAADCRVQVTRDVLAGMGISVEPLGDPLTGDVVERGSLRASATWGIHDVGTVSASAAGSIAVTSGSQAFGSAQAGDRFLQAELGASFPVAPRSTLGIGLRAAGFSRPPPGQPAAQWAAFIALGTQFPQLR